MVKLILVGGFLGSGKTTLLADAANMLAATGKKVGLITNDQAPGLVDTRLLSRIGQGVSEVSGSCFCCNFPGFVAAVESLVAQGAETIIAEPVGSCTDLSATIMNPLKTYHPEWNLAPLTVLVDPKRFREAVGEANSLVDPDALYIMKLQMDEADRICINKSDTLSESEKSELRELLLRRFPGKKTALISAKSGDGVGGWLKEIQVADDAGQTIVPVDYDRYAHGEAVLGWLNATASVPPQEKTVDGLAWLGRFMEEFRSKIQEEKSEVGHVKAILHLDGREYAAHLTRLDGEIDVREVEPKSDKPVLIFNARVQMSPESLENIVRGLLERHRASVETFRCLMPGRPNPTYRFADIV